MTIPTTPMNLYIPAIGTESAPTWASDLNNSLSIIGSHTHASGSGNQITPSGLNISSDLSYLGTSSATNLYTARFTAQSSAIPATTPNLGCIYVAGADLYYNDENGNQVRITQGGSVTGSSGTITGLPSGTASASFVSATGGTYNGTFKFLQSTSTAANIDAGALVVRYTGGYPSPSGNGVQLECGTSVSGIVKLILPTFLPSTGGQNILTLQSTGQIAQQSADYVGENMTSVGADAVAASMDATGADSIASVMDSTGSSSIASKVTRNTAATVGSTNLDVVINNQSVDSGQTHLSLSIYGTEIAAVQVVKGNRPIMVIMCAQPTVSSAYLTYNDTTDIEFYVVATWSGGSAYIGKYTAYVAPTIPDTFHGCTFIDDQAPGGGDDGSDGLQLEVADGFD